MGANGAVCATKDDLITCNDGSTHDLGPIHALAAAGYPTYDDAGRYVPTREAPVSVCVGDAEGSLHCAGARYPDDLLDGLP